VENELTDIDMRDPLWLRTVSVPEACHCQRRHDVTIDEAKLLTPALRDDDAALFDDAEHFLQAQFLPGVQGAQIEPSSSSLLSV
jgi:hypothetical protein